jgi:hypothetical protein
MTEHEKSEHPQLNDYPTSEQIETLFNAWKKGGKETLGDALSKMHPRTKQDAK